MKGREHIYWSLMGFSVFIFVFSVQQGYYDPGNFIWFALIVTIVASIIFNEVSNVVAGNKKKREIVSKTSKVDKIDPSEKAVRSGMNLLETILRLITYVTLGLVIIVCVYVGIKAADHAFFVIWSYICAAFGGIFPDFLDSTIPDDMRFHRDPLTHSTAIVSAIVVCCLITVDFGFVSLNLFAIAFLLGNTIHLLCDNFESGSTLADAFIDPIHWKECPGDIRKITEEHERSWLNSQVVIAFILLAFISLRYGMTSVDDGIMSGIVIYDSILGVFTFSTISIIVLSIIGLCYVFTIVSFIAWSREPKKPVKPVKKRSPKTK